MEESSIYDKKSLKTILGKTADFMELAKDCVAFANTKGGVLHIGIEDGDILPPSGQCIPESLPEKLTKRLNELTINVGLVANVIMAEIANRLPDADIRDIRKVVYSMVKEGIFVLNGGNRNRSYQLAKKK